MDYVVYILYSQKRSRYNVGQTQDIESRLKRHNKGLVRSTKGGAPWNLVTVITVADRPEALVLEKRMKSVELKDF